MINRNFTKKKLQLIMSLPTITPQNITQIQTVYELGEELIQKGETASTIREKIIDKGYDPHSATMIIHNIYEIKNEEKKDTAKRSLLYGSLWFIGGTFLTFLGSYIFSLAIIFASIELLQGYFLLKKCKK